MERVRFELSSVPPVLHLPPASCQSQRSGSGIIPPHLPHISIGSQQPLQPSSVPELSNIPEVLSSQRGEGAPCPLRGAPTTLCHRLIPALWHFYCQKQSVKTQVTMEHLAVTLQSAHTRPPGSSHLSLPCSGGH